VLSAWSRAADLADRTPASRNRYVDFLRGLSMLVVTVGHWLAAAPYLDATDTLRTSHVLMVVPWTSWLTWVVQVMPIFFIVGGYANGISWRAARRDGRSYASWLEGRLRRLVWPLLPLLGAWVIIVAIEYARGVRPELLLALQAPARRWLAGRAVWTATVAVNGSIMTLFIWHLTATTLVVLAAYLAGGIGLRLEPGSAAWWWTRLPWVMANAVALAPLVVAFGRFERPRATEGPPAAAWRYVVGALLTCAGLALLAAQGVGGYGRFGLNVWGLALAVAGTGLISSKVGRMGAPVMNRACGRSARFRSGSPRSVLVRDMDVMQISASSSAGISRSWR
jgi:fucose 4-O-acetylase-like acetyltransferase